MNLISQALAEANVVVVASVTDSLQAEATNVESLTLIAGAPINGGGFALHNTITGSETVDGGLGADQLTGARVPICFASTRPLSS